MKGEKYIFFIIICLLSAAYNDLLAQKNDFIVVIDAGHGAHDPGSLGKIAREKDINLAVALGFGELIEKNHTDVTVFYTRKTDIFIPLQERADFANDHKADLFISIHTNANVSSAPYGAETYTLGLAKSKSNLNVAMRENSVMMLEDDYKTRYKGFDPRSVDSYIMFELMQNVFLDKSVEFASVVQKKFDTAARYNRGVRQAGFWVLLATAAPAVLIELGFISNHEEEIFLNSKEGQQKMATAIYNAFVEYKHNHDKRSGKTAAAKPATAPPAKTSPPTAEQKTTVTDKKSAETQPDATQKPIFKVQFLAVRGKLHPNNVSFKGLPDVDFYIENDYYKYTAGNTADYEKIRAVLAQTRAKHPDAFIIAFIGERKISEQQAIEMGKQK